MNKLIKEFESIAKGIHFNNKKDNQKLKYGGKLSTTHLLSKIFFISLVIFNYLLPCLSFWLCFLLLIKATRNKRSALREECQNTEFFVVRIFLYLEWIRTRKNTVFGHFLCSTNLKRICDNRLIGFHSYTSIMNPQKL